MGSSLVNWSYATRAAFIAAAMAFFFAQLLTAAHDEASHDDASHVVQAGHEANYSATGQSEAGQSATGQSEAGQSEAGQSEAGQSEAGQSEAGQSEEEHETHVDLCIICLAKSAGNEKLSVSSVVFLAALSVFGLAHLPRARLSRIFSVCSAPRPRGPPVLANI